MLGSQWPIADAAVAPFFAHHELAFRHDIGNVAEGAGRKVYSEVFENKAFARLKEYLRDMKATPDETVR